MKLKNQIVLFISVLFLLLPVMVDAKSDYSSIDYKMPVYGDIEYSFASKEKEEHVGDNFCQDTNVINALRVVGYFIFIAKIIIPFLIIGFGIFDLAKAVTGGDSDKVTKGVKTIGIRVLIGIIVFSLPSLVDVILDVAGNLREDETGYSLCQTCILDPWACEKGEPSDLYESDDIFTDETGNVTTTKFIEKQTSSTHNAGIYSTTTSRSTKFVEKQTKSTHTAGSDATTNKPTSKIFIEVED